MKNINKTIENIASYWKKHELGSEAWFKQQATEMAVGGVFLIVAMVYIFLIYPKII